MADEIKRFNFNQVAAELGYVAEDGAGGPGPGKGPGAPAGPGSPAGPGGGKPSGPPKFPTDPESIRRNSLRFQKMWPDERAMRLQDYFNDYVQSGAPIEFEGHSICWAMIALIQKLRNNKVLMYMPPFGKSLDLIPMKRVATPKDNPMMRFDITEKGDDVHIVVTLLNDGNPDPFQMSLGDVEIREIGSGKNIWLELVGAHYLFMFDMPKTFGPDCRTMYYKEGGETWYCVASNNPAVQVGQQPAASPFDA